MGKTYTFVRFERLNMKGKLNIIPLFSRDYIVWKIMTEVKRIGYCDGNLGMLQGAIALQREERNSVAKSMDFTDPLAQSERVDSRRFEIGSLFMSTQPDHCQRLFF